MKKYGEILKQHFEKVVLIAALVGLGVAVFYLYGETQKEKDKISEFFQDVGRRAVKPVPPVDLTNYTAVINKAQNPPPLELGLPHNVLNPVKWKQTGNGDLYKEIKGTESGIDVLEVTRHVPLNFIIHYEQAGGLGLLDQRYQRSIDRFWTSDRAIRDAQLYQPQSLHSARGQGRHRRPD